MSRELRALSIFMKRGSNCRSSMVLMKKLVAKRVQFSKSMRRQTDPATLQGEWRAQTKGGKIRVRVVN